MSKRVIVILAAVTYAVALVQQTPLAFLPHGAANFVWGLAGGLSIAAIVAAVAER